MLKRTNRGSMYGLCLVALAGLPASAFAQVGTPPPATDDSSAETYTPPPPPPGFTAEGRAELARQAAERRKLEEQRAAAEANRPEPAAEPAAPKFKGIPNVNIPSDLLKNRQNSLVRGDGNGGLYDWWGPLDLHALKISPLVSEQSLEKVTPVVYDRHNRVEQRLIANLDLFREIEATKDELGGDGGIGKLSEITSIIQPIVEPATLSIDLYNAGALSAMQGKFNEEMVRAYKREETTKLRGDGANPISGFVKFMVEDAMREPRFAHDLMVGELLMNYDEIVKKAGLADRAELVPLAELAGSVGDETPRRLLITRATPYVMALSIDDHTKLLMTIRELREDPNHQPLLKVDLQKDGQTSQVVPAGDSTAPGGVKVGFAALDPGGTGTTRTGLSDAQREFYEEYLVKRWHELDPNAEGTLSDKVVERYQPMYQKYLEDRKAEIAAGDGN